MKTLVRILLIAGLVFVVFGHIKWIDYAGFPIESKAWLIEFPIIPGYAFLVMGWSGLLAERVCALVAGRSNQAA